jgi:lipid-binding SYLF domain-containing protein
MKTKLSALMFIAAMFLAAAPAFADEYDDTIALFKSAGESAEFFKKSYGYAVFPTIGKGGLGVGAAHGDGHVYEQGKMIGRVSMTQLSVGLQAGGQAFSQIIFFEHKGALDNFTSGEFEFDATVQAVAIKASATASAGTQGASTGAATGGGKKESTSAGTFRKGMAVFTVAKGGLMYQAAVGGQKFKFKPEK